GFTVVGSKPTGSFVTVGGSNYVVYQPDVQFTTTKKSFFDQWNGWGPQLDQNFRQNIGLQLQVPIFSNGTARLGYERSK
ncbi:hypothetical protein ABTP07_19845, partial [Acinetobacter baumannii]